MAVAFSTSDETVIRKSVHVPSASMILEVPDVAEAFEIQRCAAWIREKGHQVVALQFPDSLMHFSPKVAQLLESSSKTAIFVLGDTSYGECCVDEVAAEHVNAEAVIHFGHSCLTPTQRLPVLYIFTVLAFNCRAFEDALKAKIDVTSHKVAVVYDVQYHKGCQDLKFCFLCSPCSSDTSETSEQVEMGRKWPADIKEPQWKIVYIGSNENFEMLLHMTFSSKSADIFHYNPQKDVLVSSSLNVSRALMKRYMLVEKVKEADRVGILVGTLGASRYASIIDCIRKTVKEAGKRVYTFLVGKPNVPKLANFPEIDVFVLVACPENSLLDSKEFFKPIITPFELDVALNQNREWNGDFISNFRDILPGGRHYKTFAKGDTEADFSLITGRMRSNQTRDSDPMGSHALVAQDTRVATLHQMGGGDFLAQRSWQGLEQNLGETPVTLAVEGQKGIAWGYANEIEGQK